MYKNRTSLLYLLDILEAIQSIEQYTESLSFAEFTQDKKTIDAVVRNFEIIGEATRNILPREKEKYFNIPWRKMAGMRDRLIHEYFGVELEIVWKTIKEDLLEIKPLIKKVIEELKKQ